MDTQYKNKNGVLVSAKGNKATIARWNSEDRAAEILAEMDRQNCSDCSDCSGCSPQKTPMEIPKIENIHQRIFAAVSAPNALDMSSWHICDTTHCRAGWVCTLAGEKGKELETKTSTLFAAMQIYKASGYEISPCRFFDSNAKAMADMKRLAEASVVTESST